MGRAAGGNIDRLAAAVEVFAHGHATKRSMTHPYEVERVEGLLVMRDAPRRSGRNRAEEWLAVGVEAATADAVARAHSRQDFTMLAFAAGTDDEAETRAAYKALGYRLSTTEPVMVHDLERVPWRRTTATVERVLDADSLDELTAAVGRRRLRPEHLRADAPVRQYTARVDGRSVGWVTSIEACGSTYCADMFVVEAHRRAGIAAALMARLLRDDRAAGSAGNVLLASHSGALLSPTLGYERIATCLVLRAPRSGPRAGARR